MRELQGKGKGKKKKSAAAATDANGDASADPVSIEKSAAGTTRKCANCGQVGHIKTNKRYWHPCTNPLHDPILGEIASRPGGASSPKTVLWL